MEEILVFAECATETFSFTKESASAMQNSP